MFGVIALLVGSFIIFNTFSIIVAQRGREMALLRAIGAKSSQVVRSVLFEALLVGLVASVIGFVAGVLLAGLLKALLSALGVDIPASQITIPSNAIIWSFVVGTGVTVDRRGLPGDPRVAHPADRGAAAGRRRPVVGLLEARGERHGHHRCSGAAAVMLSTLR